MNPLRVLNQPTALCEIADRKLLDQRPVDTDDC